MNPRKGVRSAVDHWPLSKTMEAREKKLVSDIEPSTQ
jgi:hypothetical protein